MQRLDWVGKKGNTRDRESANFMENFARRLIRKWKIRSLLFLHIVLLGDCWCCWEERVVVAEVKLSTTET